MSDQKYSTSVLGSPGTGKSFFAASVADVVGAENTLLLATRPREASSWGYTSRGIPRELFFDSGWRPSVGKYEAKAYLLLMRRLEALFNDETYDAVIVDVGGDAFELAKHELLAPHKASNPRDTPDSMSFYGSLSYKSKELTQALAVLPFAKRPKHVIVTMHTQPAREDQQRKGVTIKSADKAAQGVEYEGTVLPMIEGGHRFGYAGEFDIIVYSDIVHEFDSKTRTSTTKYVIQTAPDKDRHAKVAVSPLLEAKTMTNTFTALLGAINGH